ncbi:uncharacterized protein LOC141629788 [Silene latifolia]|uniref:uncharacterized protein LOC141629788 n=1 Tax=Silene latifolia TaxID=37657 RepID=UPI003D782953
METDQVILNPEYPDMYVLVGFDAPDSVRPRLQKRQKFSQEKNAIINEEVEKLLDTGMVREVIYPEWLANWIPKHEAPFQDLKLYLSSPPLLAKPEKGEPLSVYLAVTDIAVSAVLVKEHEGQQHPVYYVSENLLYAEMSPNLESDLAKEVNQLENKILDQEWTLFIDGASNARGTGLGLVLKSSQGDMIVQAVSCEFKATKTKAEYETLIVRLKIKGTYIEKDAKMISYLEYAKTLTAKFPSFDIVQIPRDLNTQADGLASLGSNFTPATFDKIPIVHILEPAISKPKQVTEKEVISTNIICRYGVPSEIVCDNGTPFVAKKTKDFCDEWNINLLTSTPGYPKSNGQAESSNKVVISCLKKKLKRRRSRWAEELPFVLWADRTTPKASTGQTPYSLVYGCEAVIPAEVQVPTSRYILNNVEANSSLMQDNLIVTEELKDAAKIRITSYQQAVARTYNKNVKIRVFREGDLVIRKVFPNKKERSAGKLAPTWEGPYLIDSIIGHGAYRTLEGEMIPRS